MSSDVDEMLFQIQNLILGIKIAENSDFFVNVSQSLNVSFSDRSFLDLTQITIEEVDWFIGTVLCNYVLSMVAVPFSVTRSHLVLVIHKLHHES